LYGSQAEINFGINKEWSFVASNAHCDVGTVLFLVTKAEEEKEADNQSRPLMPNILRRHSFYSYPKDGNIRSSDPLRFKLKL